MKNPLISFISIFVFAFNAQGQRIDYDTTFTTNGQEFRIQRSQLAKYFTSLTITKGKTIILTDTMEFSCQFDLIDFNDDKGVDLIVNFIGNVDTQALFLLDKPKNIFKKVRNFEAYPASLKVKSCDNFYYSYHRSGCADMYWTSDLFRIVNFEVVHTGQIFGNGCTEPLEIRIFKIRPNAKEHVETLPFKIISDYKDKWDFIADYWAKNCGKFR